MCHCDERIHPERIHPERIHPERIHPERIASLTLAMTGKFIFKQIEVFYV